MKAGLIEWSKDIGETLVYVYSIMIAYHVGIYYGVFDKLSIISLIITYAIAYLGGNYLIDKHDRFLFKRKVKKIAKQLAIYHGYDPKTFDYSNFDIREDYESGVIEVTVKQKPDKTGEKK